MEQCPHLAYRNEGEDRTFETERAFCTVAGRFVQPLRADICNCRYDLTPGEHCEIYREHEAGSDSEGSNP